MTRALIILAAEHLPSARALATTAPFNLTDEEAETMFVPAASETGEEPATFWWASGEFSDEQYAALARLAAALSWAWCFTYNLRTQRDFPTQALQTLGLQPLTPAIP